MLPDLSRTYLTLLFGFGISCCFISAGKAVRVVSGVKLFIFALFCSVCRLVKLLPTKSRKAAKISMIFFLCFSLFISFLAVLSALNDYISIGVCLSK